MKFKKINESVTYYPGSFVDDTTFVDNNGNPYELKVSNLSPSGQGQSSRNNGDGAQSQTSNNLQSQDNSNDDTSQQNSDQQNNTNNQQQNADNRPNIRINNKTGKREIYIPQMKIWRAMN